MSNLEPLDELIEEGEELVPKGGRDLAAGHNSELQAEYSTWREQCVAFLKDLGAVSQHLLRELESDTRGPYFYQSSASRVLGVIKAARFVSLEQEDQSR